MAKVIAGVQDETSYWLGDLDVDDFTEVQGPLSTVLVDLLSGAGPACSIWRCSPPFHPM